jgi:RHS repeat-associated protein
MNIPLAIQRKNMKYLFSIALLVSTTLQAQVITVENLPAANNSLATVSYVRTWQPVKPIIDPVLLPTLPTAEVKQNTTYIDGLGRAIQTVGKQQSPLGKDVVSYNVFDAYGRETIKYLPYESQSADGYFKTNPFVEQKNFYNTTPQYEGEKVYYSKAIPEAAPLGRIEKTMPAGNSWAGNGRGTSQSFEVNTLQDEVRIWNIGNNINDIPTTSAIYPTGTLYKIVTTDEHGNKVIEYKDKADKVILKKVQISQTAAQNHDGWLCTYYIYDIYDNLSCVIQPEAVKQLSTLNFELSTLLLAEQCFRYEYDHRNRMIVKKVPGAAPVYMIYDNRDRLILTQDGKMAESHSTSDESKPPQWLYTEYDELNRPRRTSLVALFNAADYFAATGALMLTKQFAATTNTDIAGYFSGYGLNEWSEYGPAILTETFYDNYDWATGKGIDANMLSTEVNYNNNEFQTPTNSTYPYPQPIAASNATKGMVTGTLTRVLSSQIDYPVFLYSLVKYDDKGRVIQTKSSNHMGGLDVVTTQYSFSNQVLMTRHKHHIYTNAADPIITNTRYAYDDLGRPTSISKRLSAGTVNAGAAYKKTVSMEYDALGQLKKKTLGQKPSSTVPLANLTFDYNIRGWLLGTNRSFLQDNNTAPDQWFGFELGYDKPTNRAGQNFAAQQYNGNISGNVWRSQGDMVKRKYDYGYDAASRLLKSSFEQRNTNLTWNNAEMDFTSQMGDGVNANTAYDYNGNILAMKQYGYKIGQNASTPAAAGIIDDLSYTYYTNSNKLKAVTDNGVANNKLGDFDDAHIVTDPNSTYFADYGYDVNGNLVTDLNKGMKNSPFSDNTGLDVSIGNSAIIYNHLNLPMSIFVRNPQTGMNKGCIYYNYDAAGNKLEKRTQEYGAASGTTITSYVSGFVYETKTMGNTTNYTNRLQFTSHEEGRVRALYSNAAQPNTLTDLAFDYMLKDHLGNVRVVITEEQQQDIYPAATLEPALVATESGFYAIDPSRFKLQSEIPSLNNPVVNYWNNNITTLLKPNNNPSCSGNLCTNANSTKLYRLKSSEAKTGLGITLKVMAGDKIDVAGKSYFFESSVPPSSNNLSILNIITGFLGGATGAAATSIHGAVTPAQIDPLGTNIRVDDFFNEQNNQTTTNKPRAFINVIFFDEQFKVVDYKVSVVGSSGQLKDHYNELNNIAATKSGFVYIYCSNETNIDVYFDNVQVVHTRSPLLEENSFYSFGLKMEGISSRAAGGIENKYGITGKELQSKEFSDGSGLEMYDFGARFQDPQIGRWFNVDPMAEQVYSHSPYVYVANNPVGLIDPDGREFDGDVDFVKRIKDEAGSLIKSEERSQKNLQDRIDKRAAKGKSTANLERQLQDSKDKVGELNATITEIGEMDASETVYYVNSNSSEDGTNYDVKNGRVNIGVKNSSDYGAFSHELKHGYQFEKGLVDFEGKKGKPFVLYDITDEVSAYKREYAFGSNPTGSSYMSGINAGNVRSLSEQQRDAFGNVITAYPYKNLYNGNINTSTTLGAINQAWIASGGLPIPGVEKYKDVKYSDAKSSGILKGFISK